MTNAPTPFGPDAVARLTIDTEPWLSCDDCFERVDELIEDTFRTRKPLPEPFRVHLVACAVCHEEARSLAALIADDFGLSPEEGSTGLDQATSLVRSQ